MTCFIPYLEIGLGLRIKTSELLLPTSQERRTITQKKKKKTELEWMLNQNIFTNIISKFGFQPEVDLFTSRLNAQIPLLVSYHPNPEAIYINAFSIPWQEMHRPFHEFTHFAVIRRV